MRRESWRHCDEYVCVADSLSGTRVSSSDRKCEEKCQAMEHDIQCGGCGIPRNERFLHGTQTTTAAIVSPQ